MPDLRRSFAALDELNTPDLKSDIQAREGMEPIPGSTPSNAHRMVVALVAIVIASAGVLLAVTAIRGTTGGNSPSIATHVTVEPTPRASVPVLMTVPQVSVSEVGTLHVGQMSAAQEGFGSLWVALITKTGDQEVVRLDPSSGATEATYHFPSVQNPEWGGRGIAIGAGSVWVAGAAEGRATVFRIDPVSGRVERIELDGRQVQDVTFEGRSVWALVGKEDSSSGQATVVDLDAQTGKVMASTGFDAPWYEVVLAAQRTAWVQERNVQGDTVEGGELAQIVPGDVASVSLGGSFADPVSDGTSIWAPFSGNATSMNLARGIARVDPLTGQVIHEWKVHSIGYDIAAGHDGGVWFLGGKGLERLNPSTGKTDVDETVNGTPIFIVSSSNDGIWVATYEGALVHFDVQPIGGN